MKSNFIEGINSRNLRNLKFTRTQWLVIRNIYFLTLVTLMLTLAYTLIRLAFNVAF